MQRKSVMRQEASFQMSFKEVKVLDNGYIRIKGFASTPQIDRYDDIVNPAAFANAMTTYMANPVVLLGHNPDNVLGKVIEYNLSNAGLEVTVELTNNINNTFENINNKNLRGFSIGFICKSATYREEGNREIREIMELDLIEISVVSTPANPSSLFTLAKSLRGMFADIEKKEAEAIGGSEVEQEKEENHQEDESQSEETPADDEKGCGKKPKKDEDEEDIEEASKKKDSEEAGEQKESKTEKEAPSGETPETPEAVDVPATDKSEPVKAGEEPAQVERFYKAEEVEALVNKAVQEAVEQKLAELAKPFGEAVEASEKLKKRFDAFEADYKQLEADILNTEVRPMQQKVSSKSIHVSDEMVLKTLGHR